MDGAVNQMTLGRGSDAVVKAACLESRKSRLRTPLWHSNSKKRNVFSLLTRKDSILWRASVRRSELGLSPPGLDFRIVCSEGSAISLISPPSGGFPGPVLPICAQRWPNTSFIIKWHCLPDTLFEIRAMGTLPPGRRGFPQYGIFTSRRGGNITFIWNLNTRAKSIWDKYSLMIQTK